MSVFAGPPSTPPSTYPSESQQQQAQQQQQQQQAQGRRVFGRHETDAKMWEIKYQQACQYYERQLLDLKASADKQFVDLKNYYEQRNQTNVQTIQEQKVQIAELSAKLDKSKDDQISFLKQTSVGLHNDYKASAREHVDTVLKQQTQLSNMLSHSIQAHNQTMDHVIQRCQNLLPLRSKMPKKKALTMIQADVEKERQTLMAAHPQTVITEAQVQKRIQYEVAKDEKHYSDQFWKEHLQSKLPSKVAAVKAIQLIDTTLVEVQKQVEEMKVKVESIQVVEERKMIVDKMNLATDESKRLVEEKKVIEDHLSELR